MGLKNYSNGTDVPLETSSDNEIDPVPITNNMLFIYQSANMQNMQSIQYFVVAQTNLNYQIATGILTHEEVIPMLFFKKLFKQR